MPVNAWRPLALALLLCLAGIGAYTPGFSGAFFLDDYHVIVNNPALQQSELSLSHLGEVATSSDTGPLKRPISMASFWLSHHLVGTEASAHKLTNAILHGACTALLFGLCSLLIKTYTPSAPSISIGALAAAIWSLHPLQASSVLYVSQRMTILAALFSLLSMLFYLLGRRVQLQQTKLGSLWFAAAVLAAIAGIYSKESALLIPLYWGLIELCCLQGRCATEKQKLLLKCGWSVILLTALAGAATIFALRGTDFIVNGYTHRDFSLSERFLTEFRVIWLYLKMLALPALQDMALYHDDITLSQGLTQPWTTLSSMLATAALLAIAVKLKPRHPWLTYGVGIFFAGHLLESTVFALEIAYEHRNYMPSTGLALTAATSIHAIAARLPRRMAKICAYALPITLLSILTFWRASIWGEPFEMLKDSLQNHPDSPRTQLWAGDTFVQLAALASPQSSGNLKKAAQKHYLRAYTLNTIHISGLIEASALGFQLSEPEAEQLSAQTCLALSNQLLFPATLYTLQEAKPLNVLATSGLPESVWKEWVACAQTNPNLRRSARKFLASL